ncbi:glycosyltransferase [Pseudozyma hubeiensis SY62]|uniref:Mannosyltransferase n=1 Tax=Pseudozyma hubeiensis (strain SY62) TaxID=1305764 RepID=R9P0Y6_PSEHS|nr:glycosyltransferase [Pseudozyma hubeiensis SY62]GAC94908.1 glycosyltransferase [Pseudozyma hubeiensis SY62]
MPAAAMMSQRWWSMFDPRTRHGQIYLFLLAVRCYSALYGYGYIHPDEWMQSGEPYFGFSLDGVEARLTWEWHPEHALRSLSALVMQYLAVEPLLKIYRLLSSSLSGQALFLIQRINMLFWTLVLDVSVVFILPPQIARHIHYLFGISTAATTFLIRPFSNSFEAHLLAFCLLHVSNFFKDPAWYKSAGVVGLRWGVLLALIGVDGFFTRFTFAIFALPLAIFVLYRHVQVAAEGHKRTALGSLAIAVNCVVIFLAGRVESDTNFYTRAADTNGVEVAGFWGTKWVVPPINALLYNLKTENVAQHGLHPRWLHVVVNLPMMVGVANCVILVVYGWQFGRERLHPGTAIHGAGNEGAMSQDEQERIEVEQTVKGAEGVVAGPSSTTPSQTSDDQDIPYVDNEPIIVPLSLATIIFALAILSLSPHQEPRFLLPLAFPSTIIMAYALQSPTFTSRPSLTRTLCVLHVIQHILQLVLFSFLHQAALLPTLFSIDTSFSHLPSHNPLWNRYEHHLLYRTFSVPLHFLPNKVSGMYPRVEQYDSATDPGKLVHMASTACDHTWVYAPTWVVGGLQEDAHKQGRVEMVGVGMVSWHLDMDHLSESWALIKEVGWKEAFAIQKLAVQCIDHTQIDDTVESQGQPERPQVDPPSHDDL